MAAFRFHDRRTRRWWKIGAAFTAFAALAIVFVAGSGAVLAPSTFEGGDGNLTCCDSGGTTDWANLAGRAGGVDNPSGTSDNSFGQGTKEDDSNVTVVSGSIPPNKSDLTRFYEGSETIGSGASAKVFLYLAWERSNVLGSANMDFEINQAATPGLGSPGPHTINRTAGDLLVTYDFTNGGSRPDLHILTWVTSGATSQCFSANKLPCWGNRISLNGANSEGAINTVQVTDPIPPNNPRTLDPNEFGEASINLTDAGIFTPGVCKAFGSVFLKSRSSASFTAEAKDFVAPVPVNISNCGQIIIRKVTDPNPDPTDSSFSYSTTGGLSPASFNLKNGQKQDYGSSVQAGSYSVTEADPTPLNFAFVSLNCDASDTSHGSTVGIIGRTVNIALAPDDVIDCTYTNKLQLGAIKITKTSTKGNAPLAGAIFNVDGSPAPATDANGVTCVDHLTFGNHTVQEVSAPTGYKVNDTTVHNVDVEHAGTCSDPVDASQSLAFDDTPLSRITTSFESLADGNPTSATIDCSRQGDPVPLPEGTPDVQDNLAPGTYTCTVVIDP
jgi:hypothetical protein